MLPHLTAKGLREFSSLGADGQRPIEALYLKRVC
jgi:hypothetical protein